MIFPIGFSIPACKIVDKVPEKTRETAIIIPGDFSTYIYQDEESYYKGYQESWFGITKKKSGWDCLRHYEILANGCIPMFEGLENCPPKIMTHFPKELVLKANQDLVNKALYAEQLLNYTREHLTTKAMASYVLKMCNKESIKSVLYLSGEDAWGLYVDYLRCLTLHGFKELFGAQCHDYPKVPHLYKDYPGDRNQLYGKGFSCSYLLDSTKDRNDELDKTVLEDIRQHKYDLIIYGSIHRGHPFIDTVTWEYHPTQVVFFCGEDMYDTTEYARCPLQFYSEKGHPCFIREIQE